MAFSDRNKIILKNLNAGEHPTTRHWFLLDYSLPALFFERTSLHRRFISSAQHIHWKTCNRKKCRKFQENALWFMPDISFPVHFYTIQKCPYIKFPLIWYIYIYIYILDFSAFLTTGSISGHSKFQTLKRAPKENTCFYTCFYTVSQLLSISL